MASNPPDPATLFAQATAAYIALLAQFTAQKTALANWAGGTLNGGPNGDGSYPFVQPDGTTLLIPCPARLAQALVNVVTLTGPGPFSLSEAAHGGRRLRIGNGAATAAITVILPNNARVGTVLLPRQVGTAPLKFAPAAGATLAASAAGLNGTAAQNTAVALTCESNTGGNAALWVLDGPAVVVP